MNIIEGNLIEMADSGEFDAIMHGCNCFCTMGAGIAKNIRDRWPEVYDIDRQTVRGATDKLGKFTFAVVKTRANTILTVFNLYTQYRYGMKYGPPFDYDAFTNALRGLKPLFVGENYTVGMPMIGAGLAGGDWRIISEIIEEEFQNVNYNIVRYHGKGKW